MYDAREKAIRDHDWAIHVARDEGTKERENRDDSFAAKVVGVSPASESEFIGKTWKNFKRLRPTFRKGFRIEITANKLGMASCANTHEIFAHDPPTRSATIFC